MKLLLIRHAWAKDAERFARKGGEDWQRHLTQKGKRQMAKAVKGLRRLLPAIQLIAYSPYKRTRQTARILHKAYPKAGMMMVEELAPGEGQEAMARWLGYISRRATLAVIGHEPDLTRLAHWLCGAAVKRLNGMGRGSVLLLHSKCHPCKGSSRPQWLLSAKQLRAIAKGKSIDPKLSFSTSPN